MFLRPERPVWGMVRILELITGLLLFPAALWAFLYPRRDFELGKKLGFIGIRNREQLELNRVGVIRHRIGASLLLLLAIALVVDSILLLT
jgi:hypothetical protein